MWTEWRVDAGRGAGTCLARRSCSMERRGLRTRAPMAMSQDSDRYRRRDFVSSAAFDGRRFRFLCTGAIPTGKARRPPSTTRSQASGWRESGMRLHNAQAPRDELTVLQYFSDYLTNFREP
jgi:hypothetical protein